MQIASKEEHLRSYYAALYRSGGRQHWWPARTRFEVIVGAYLTQNTAWTNVERALRRLRAAGLLKLDGIRNTPLRRLESLIRSAGYFRQKARRLKIFVNFLDKHYAGSLSRMFAQPTDKLRNELLGLNGVGPETADSILLYAGQHPVFVVDAYTRRIFARHQITHEKAGYDDIRKLVERSLFSLRSETPLHAPQSRNWLPKILVGGSSHAPSPMSLARRPPLVQIYNEMHGLIVGVGKNYCLKAHPRCDGCPLQRFLPGVSNQ